jgi:predicted AlkP superfamily pyrophosphatase or phosphodiesterase
LSGSDTNPRRGEKMMRSSVSRIILIAALLLVASPAAVLRARGQGERPPAPRPRDGAHVIMISIDGLVPDYYTQSASVGLRVPHLSEMKLGGAYAEGVEGVYPSVTYPSHTTLVSGVRPAAHGIIQNRIFEAPTDEQTREWYWFSKDLKAETLWTLAKKSGLVTAAVGWPVTVGAEIDYNVPEIIDPKESPPTPKRSLQHTTPGLIQSALNAGAFGKESGTDARRTAISEFIITSYKPGLMLIHLVELDGAHHRYGTRSPQALQTAERLDGYIGRIVEATRKAGIFDKTTFLIVSDHGFAAVEKKFAPNVTLVKEKLITLDASGKPSAWKAAAWPAGGSCAIVLKDPSDKESAAKVASVFGQMAARGGGPVGRVLTPDEMKRLGAIPNAALMLDAAPGIAFAEDLTGPEVYEAKDYRGTHGHLPTRAEMRSSLIVYGEGARAGAKVGLARMIDIGPTAAALLGLSFPKAEGSAIRELIKPSFIPPPQPAQRKK